MRAHRLQALEAEYSRLLAGRAVAAERRAAAREAFDRRPDEEPEPEHSGVGAGVHASPSGPSRDEQEPEAEVAPADVLAVETRRLREVTTELGQLQATLGAVPEPRLSPTDRARTAMMAGNGLLVLLTAALVKGWLSGT